MGFVFSLFFPFCLFSLFCSYEKNELWDLLEESEASLVVGGSPRKGCGGNGQCTGEALRREERK